MKPIPKINKSIEYFEQICEILDTMFYQPIWENKELLSFIEKEDNKGIAIIKYYKKRYGKSFFNSEEDAIQHIYNKQNVLKRQEEALRLLKYNLFPFSTTSTKNNSFSDDKKSLQKLLGLKDKEVENVIEHLENREIVYYKDVVIEMEEFPENLDNAEKYLDVIYRKYKKAFQNVPNKKHYNWEYFMQGKNNSEHYKGIEKLLKAGLLTKKEAEIILFNACSIVKELNFKISLLKDKYNEVKYTMGIDKEETNPPFDFQNNFDGTDKEKIYKYFKENLCDKNYLSETELHQYLKDAFELKTVSKKYTLQKKPYKKIIYRIFYDFYVHIAGKPYGVQEKYASLLGEYFLSYNSKTVSTSFSKSAY